jgi:hypothetical protein
VLVQVTVVCFVSGWPVACCSYERQKCADHYHEPEERGGHRKVAIVKNVKCQEEGQQTPKRVGGPPVLFAR